MNLVLLGSANLEGTSRRVVDGGLLGLVACLFVLIFLCREFVEAAS
jgi:hypothetical protein